MIYYYPHPEMFENFEKPDFMKYSGNLIVWGAGRIGGVAEHCLRKAGVKILAFCDIAKDKWGTKFCGHEVISPETLKKNYPNAAIIISAVCHSAIYETISNYGYQNVFDCSSLFLKIDFEGYNFWMLPEYAIRNVEQYMAAVYEQIRKENSIDQIYLNITTKCSLRCRDCSVFIPYVNNPCIYDADEIMKDFKHVLDCLGYIRIVNFYGGEPLIHPKLAEMILELKDEKRIDRISIITNGTIIPNERLLQVLKDEPRIMIRISDYGILSSKLKELEQILSEYHIAYEVSNYTYWDAPSKIALCNESEEQLMEKFQLCTACNILFLLNRKLYLCCTVSAVNNIGGFPPSETNYVDLEKYSKTKEILEKEIQQYVARPKNKQYMDACKYCSGLHCIHFEDKVPVAVQTKDKLEFPKLY